MGGRLLITRQGISVDLHPTGALLGIGRPDLVQAQYLARRIVELVMVDLVMGQGRVEGDLNIRRKRDVLHCFGGVE